MLLGMVCSALTLDCNLQVPSPEVLQHPCYLLLKAKAVEQTHVSLALNYDLLLTFTWH